MRHTLVSRFQSLFATALAAGTLMLAAPSAGAATASPTRSPSAPQLGVGVTAAPLQAAHSVKSGPVDVTPVYVINTGNRPETVALTIQHIDRSSRHVLPATWVHLASTSIDLLPGKSTTVGIRVNVPNDASAAAYATDVVATASPAGTRSASAVKVGAAAAAVIYLTVAGHGGPPPRLWLGAGGGALVAVVLAGSALAPWHSQRRAASKGVAGRHRHVRPTLA